MFLADLSIKRPVMATVSILALIALGIMSFFTLGINEWPEVEFPYVAVTITEPGASPQQIENNITRKVEDALGQVSGVKHIYSHVHEGYTVVFAEFTLETEPAVAAQDVRDKIGTIRGELPADATEPIIARYDPSAEPVMSLAVTGDLSLPELTTLVNDSIRKKLESVNGVGVVNVLGEQLYEVQIQLNLDKMASYGLTVQEVIAGLKGENLEVPVGSITVNDRKINLRLDGKVQSLTEFAAIPVAKRGGVQLYVKDIANVVSTVKDPDSLSFYQGEAAIGMNIIKQSGSNTVEVSDRLRTVIAAIKETLPAGVNLDIVADNSVRIRNSVNDVVKTIIEGAILAILTVFLFLGNWRTTIISAIAIPTSLISTFFAMKLFGYTLNMMTLMALSLSVGLLIDDSIVVIENIERHLRLGKTPIQAAKEATSEIGLAVLATTFSLVAVFFPVGMMGGITGRFFKQFGITVVVAVLVSLFVSFTLVPMLSSRYLTVEKHRLRGPLGRFVSWFNRSFESITVVYVSLLRKVFHHRLKVIMLAALLFVGSLSLIPILGTSFMPTTDTGEIKISALLDSGLSDEAAIQVTKEVERVIRSFPEVDIIYSTVSDDELSIYVQLQKDRKRSVYEVIAAMRPEINALPGVQASLNARGFMEIGKDIQYSLLGNDMSVLQEYAAKAERIMENIAGITDVENSYMPGKPEENIRIRTDVAADLGVSTGLIADTLHTLYSGAVVGQFKDGDNNYDVRVILEPSQRQKPAELDKIYVPGGNYTQQGPAMISLGQVTEKTFAPAPSRISRSDRMQEIRLSANLAGISLGEFEKKFAEAVKELELPAGYKFVARGQSEFMGESFAALGIALVLGVLFIFFILAVQFESYIDPFAIMFALPLAAIGAILALLLAGDDFGLLANIGIIMLMGLVTKNAILLIDFTKQQRAKGVARNEALLNAGKIRLRPIIMTSFAMIFGMLPLAVGIGQGAELRAPMAHAVIGGVITSTLLTLLVVPVMYTFFDDLRQKFRPDIARKSAVQGKQGEQLADIGDA